MSIKTLVWIIIVASCAAQTPLGVTASMYEPTAPGFMAYVVWQPVSGATEYNVYKEVGSIDSTCPATFPAAPEDTVTDNFYIDNPNPGWYEIPVTGGWKQRTWCYAVTAIVNGVESAKSQAAFVAIGNSGYLNLTFKNTCTGGNIVPFPYMANQVSAHFYYTGSDGVAHEFPTVHLYNAYPYPAGDPQHAYNEEWEWKLPVVALDGTVVPWDRAGKYTYTLKTPDGGYVAGWFAPRYQLDASYYNQVTLARIPSISWCPIPDGPGGNYSFWQNVTR